MLIDHPPRIHAERMLQALRTWWAEYQKANIPEEFRGMTNAYVISEMAKSQFRRRK